jgi:hypothetical protein
VHLCIADSANDQHDNELWMSLDTISKKARVSRRSAYTAIRELLDVGLLEELRAPVDANGKPTGKPGLYRFLFPDVAVVFETRRKSRQATIAHLDDERQATIAEGQATIAHGVGNHCSQSQETPSRTQTKSSSSRDVELRLAPVVADLFDVFWAKYPKRVGKKDARTAFERALKKKVDPGVLIAGAEAYARRCQNEGTESRFIKYPQAWLNGERWNDEPDVDSHWEMLARLANEGPELRAIEAGA